MARANGHKRLSRKARHLISRLKRTRHASVQDVGLHELKHEINRSFWKKAKPMGRAPQTAAGVYRPPTRRAKRLLTQLRHAKVWRLQQRLVTEIAREFERGKRLVDKARAKARRAQAKAARYARRAANGARRAGRGARATARAAARAGRATRRGVRTASERHLSRAERRHARRAANGPGRTRRSGRPVFVFLRRQSGRFTGRAPAAATSTPRRAHAPVRVVVNPPAASRVAAARTTTRRSRRDARRTVARMVSRP